MNANNSGSEGDNMQEQTPTTDANQQQDVNAVPDEEAAPTSPDEATAQADSPDSAAPIAEQAESDAHTTGDAPNGTPPPEADVTPAEPAAAPPTRFSRGDVVTGTVAATAPTQINVDLGEGDEGIIPGRELEHMAATAVEELTEGSEVKVFVVNPNDHQGRIILSVNRAIEEQNWADAEVYRQNQEVFEGSVAGYNRGGLIVRFGRLRGFVPQSQIADDRRAQMDGSTPEERFSGMVGDHVFVKVMEVDRSRNRLILSERAAARERREQRKEQLIDELAVGQVVEGRVVSLEDFGAFVDVGGAEGLVHLTEITWKHITHPREVLRIGQQVRVEVISVDEERKRIGLSIKRQEADPWDEVATTYAQGQLVQGTVTKLAKFGAFARLVDAPDIEGLIHISELSEQRVGHPREVVEEGERLTLRVVKIDVKNRRLGLSLKRVNSAEYLDVDMRLFAEDAERMENDAAEEEGIDAAEPDDADEEVIAQTEAEANAPVAEAAPVEEAAVSEEAPVAEAEAVVETEAEPETTGEAETEETAEPVEETDED